MRKTAINELVVNIRRRIVELCKDDEEMISMKNLAGMGSHTGHCSKSCEAKLGLLELSGQRVADFSSSRVNAAFDYGNNGNSDAYDGCGQNNPVNGYCAGLVFGEFFHCEQFHLVTFQGI